MFFPTQLDTRSPILTPALGQTFSKYLNFNIFLYCRVPHSYPQTRGVLVLVLLLNMVLRGRSGRGLPPQGGNTASRISLRGGPSQEALFDDTFDGFLTVWWFCGMSDKKMMIQSGRCMFCHGFRNKKVWFEGRFRWLRSGTFAKNSCHQTDSNRSKIDLLEATRT